MKGKKVLVTNANGPLGKALAIAAARRGAAKVFMCVSHAPGAEWDRYSKDLKQVAAECKQAASEPGFEAFVTPINVSKPEEARKAAGDLVRVHGVVDLLINNAGDDPDVRTNHNRCWPLILLPWFSRCWKL